MPNRRLGHQSPRRKESRRDHGAVPQEQRARPANDTKALLAIRRRHASVRDGGDDMGRVALRVSGGGLWVYAVLRYVESALCAIHSVIALTYLFHSSYCSVYHQTVAIVVKCGCHLVSSFV